MTNPAAMVLLAGAALALLLAGRGLARHRLPMRRLVIMALVWALVIAGLTLVLQRTRAG